MHAHNVNRFIAFVKERHSIHLKRKAGGPKPWTEDKILQTYKFCNVYRELDAVTVWIAKYWRDKHQKDPDLWFAMAVARLVNWPATLGALGYPVPWKPGAFKTLLKKRTRKGLQNYSGAYMISTHGVKMDKAVYLADCALTPMWKDRKKIRPVPGRPLQEFHERLITCRDMGTFMSAQVIADIKYAKPFLNAPDWWTFAAPGPGSRRGLNRLLGWGLESQLSEKKWKEELDLLLQIVNHSVTRSTTMKMERLHAQDLQNCLCEFDKYERVRLGEGRPKSLYPGV